ncbi:MAG TPA: DUF6599 family protein [Blastocatellia bacterium]|nr:DUF6599 family protein [Blastocatellia bacterium]
MKHRKALPTLALLFLSLAPAGLKAQPAPPAEAPAPRPEVVSLASMRLASEFLPETLSGFKATGPIRQYGSENLHELVAERAEGYKEYSIISIASRQYGPVRVDVFQTEHPFSAYGLFSYSTTGARTGNERRVAVGADGAYTPVALVFWKHNYFVSVSDGKSSEPRQGGDARARLAAGLAANIASSNARPDARPPLLDSLPREFRVARSERYFLGPESLNSTLPHAKDMFEFDGDAEAVTAEYEAAPGAPPLKLAIVEYHTPQFATDALARVKSLIESLPEDRRGRIIVKREGNYVIEAQGVEDRDFAEQLLGKIEYPYTVKWLRDPLLVTNDPFHIQKAAQMLVSTFTIIGLMLGTVLVGGAIFGTTIFFKRRKQQREIFSDAGGMLRLDIDPVETFMLGLPPRRGED